MLGRNKRPPFADGAPFDWCAAVQRNSHTQVTPASAYVTPVVIPKTKQRSFRAHAPRTARKLRALARMRNLGAGTGVPNARELRALGW